MTKTNGGLDDEQIVFFDFPQKFSTPKSICFKGGFKMAYYVNAGFAKGNTGRYFGGSHIVHKAGCRYEKINTGSFKNNPYFVSLGNHGNCAKAVAAAKKRGYGNARGCNYCCP